MNDVYDKRDIILREFEGFVQTYSASYTDYGEEVLKATHALLKELLKAQEPHVMTEAELRAIQSETPVWVEVPFEGCDSGHWVLISYQQYIYKGLRCSFDDGALEGIGVKWRCWTSRPDYETRRDTPW